MTEAEQSESSRQDKEEMQPAEELSDAEKAYQQKRGNMKGMHAGYTMAASVLVGFGIGYALDGYMDWHPWGKVICSFMFIGAGLYQVVKENMPKS